MVNLAFFGIGAGSPDELARGKRRTGASQPAQGGRRGGRQGCAILHTRP